MKLNKIVLMALFFMPSVLCAQVTDTTKIEKLEKKEYKTVAKISSTLFLGIINPAVEFKLYKKLTLQFETMGIFANSNFLKTDKPFSESAVWLELRYYPRNTFSGFFAAGNVGYSVYRVNKNIVPEVFTGYKKGPGSVGVGQCVMAGVTLGWHFKLSERWGLEASMGGGIQGSGYEEHKYAPYDGFVYNDISYKKGEIYSYDEWNKSAEWLIYKAGLFATYKF